MAKFNWTTLSGGRGQLPKERDADSAGKVDPPTDKAHRQLRPIPRKKSVVAMVRQTGKMVPDRYPSWLEQLAVVRLTPRQREIRGYFRALLPEPIDGGSILLAGDPPSFLTVIGPDSVTLVRLQDRSIPPSPDHLRRWTIYSATIQAFDILAVRSLLSADQDRCIGSRRRGR